MFCVECFADAAFAAQESDFLFAHFDFDGSAHRAKLLARHRADALCHCVELIAFCLTFFRNERDVTGVHFLQRSVSIRLNLGDTWRAANKNLLPIDDCRFHRGVNWFAHDGARSLSRCDVCLDRFPMFGIELFPLAAFATKESDLLADFDFDGIAHRTKGSARDGADFLYGNLQLIGIS